MTDVRRALRNVITELGINDALITDSSDEDEDISDALI